MSFIPVNFGISNAGNTSGSSGTVSNQILFAGGNNITLSQSTSAGSATVTISAGAGGAAGTNTFGISNLGNTSGTTGTINGSNAQFLLAGGNNVTLSQSINGSSATVTISAANPSADTFGISNLGNTAGTSGVISSSPQRMLFAGGNNITLSQSVNGASATITVSAPNASSNTFGISNLGNTSGTSGTINGAAAQLLLSCGTNITHSQSVNG